MILMTRTGTARTFWVKDSAGKIVGNHPRKWQAVEHAERIGGTWCLGRY
jgi:hypothetical protein